MKAITKHPRTNPAKLTPKAWKQLMLTADEFAFAAERYKCDSELRHVAVFLLHQATHIALMALNRSLAISPERTPDIAAHFEVVTRLNPGIAAAFPRATREEKRLFKVLMQTAHVTHCHTWPQLTEAEIGLLQEWISDLNTRVEAAYKANKKRKLKVVE